MNYIDILILATLVLCFLLGLISGLIWQVAGIISLCVGIVATIFFGPLVSQAMARWIDSPSFARLFGYIAVFSLASMGVRILATVFAKVLQRFKLDRLDKLLGGIVGLAKAVLICAVVVIILGRYGTVGSRQAVEASLLGGRVVTLVDFVAGKADEYNVTEKAKDAWEKGKTAADRLQEKGRSLLDEHETPSPEAEGAGGASRPGE